MSEPTVADPMIEVSGVRKAFGETQALDGVDLQVPAATVLGLLGPNGAGKTTLVKVLATLLRPDAGWAQVDGLDVVRQPVAVRSVIGLAGQYAAVDEMLTGRENLEMVGRLYRLEPQGGQGAGRGGAGAPDLADAADRSVRTLLRRHAPAPRPRRQPRRAAPRADPRRADDRPRPAHPHGALGLHPAARPGRHDRAPDDAVPGGGRRAGRAPSSSSTTARSSPGAPPTS